MAPRKKRKIAAEDSLPQQPPVRLNNTEVQPLPEAAQPEILVAPVSAPTIGEKRPRDGADEAKPIMRDAATQTDDGFININPEERYLRIFLEKIKNTVLLPIVSENLIKDSFNTFVFISYAWKPDSDSVAQKEHNAKVSRLAQILEWAGFKVIYDRVDLSGDIDTWMEDSIRRTGQVIVIGSPELKNKIEDGQKKISNTHVYKEYKFIQQKKARHTLNKSAAGREEKLWRAAKGDKVIVSAISEIIFPVLIEGEMKDSFPDEILKTLVIDCTDDENKFTEEALLPGMLNINNKLGLIPALLNLRPSQELGLEKRVAYSIAFEEYMKNLQLLKGTQKPRTYLWGADNNLLQMPAVQQIKAASNSNSNSNSF